MFQKLRTDLVKKLAGIRLVLINGDGFAENGGNGIYGELANGNYIQALRQNDVEFVAFSRADSEAISSVAERLGIELHQRVSNIPAFYNTVKIEHGFSDKEIAFICRDESDLPVIGKVGFSAVTPEAPLHVKACSYFSTYNSGGPAVSEVAALILKARKYPGGWSE